MIYLMDLFKLPLPWVFHVRLAHELSTVMIMREDSWKVTEMSSAGDLQVRGEFELSLELCCAVGAPLYKDIVREALRVSWNECYDYINYVEQNSVRRTHARRT